MDPPYRKDLARPGLEAMAAGKWLADGAVCVIELAKNENLDIPATFQEIDRRTYGSTQLVFLVFEGRSDE